MSDKQEQTVVRPETINMQTHENVDGWESPIPGNWVDDYDSEQGSPLYESPSEEIADLKRQLMYSQIQVELFQKKWVAAINRGSDMQKNLGLASVLSYCVSIETHKNYVIAPRKQIVGLKNKLKKSENKVKDLQNRFVGNRNSEDQTDVRNQQQELKQPQNDFQNLKTNSEKTTENEGKELDEKCEAASDEAARYKFQLDQLQKEFQNSQTKSDKTICGLTRQLQMLQNKLQNNKENSEKTIENLKTQLEVSENKLKELQQSFHDNKKTSEETIDELKTQLQYSESKGKELHEKWEAASDEAAQHKFQLDQLQKEFKNSQTNSDKTICGLKNQLQMLEMQLRNNKENSEKSKQQEQIQQQLQQQLQEAQRELEEQATQRRQEREQFQSEMEELKFQLVSYKDLYASYLKITEEEKEEKNRVASQLEKAKAEKKLLQETVERLQESDQEKHGTEKGKEEKGDSLLDTVKSLQESLKTKQEKETILNAKLDELEAHPTIEAEKPKKKKKKRNWFLRLFTRNASQ